MKRALSVVKKPQMSAYQVMVAGAEHLCFVPQIVELIAISAKERGTGRGKRDPQELIEKINKGQAIIALCQGTQELAGFCYVESYENGKFFANSALIVAHEFRGAGLARLIKLHAYKLGQTLFPQATPITITTSTAVMKLNEELGYHAVAFSEITTDEKFWKGCEGCVNFPILTQQKRQNCLCTAMKGAPAKEGLTSITPRAKQKSPRLALARI